MLEGISFLLLLGVAMPLKYMFGLPEAVRYAGWIHGVLFVIYCPVIFQAWAEKILSFGHATLAFVFSMLPFGPFLIDRRLARLQ